MAFISHVLHTLAVTPVHCLLVRCE